MAAPNNFRNEVYECLKASCIPLTRIEIENRIKSKRVLPNATCVKDAIQALKKKGLIAVQNREPVGVPEFFIMGASEETDDPEIPITEEDLDQEMPSDTVEASKWKGTCTVASNAYKLGELRASLRESGIGSSGIEEAVEAIADAADRIGPAIRNLFDAIQAELPKATLKIPDRLETLEALERAAKMMYSVDHRRSDHLYRLRDVLEQMEEEEV